MKILLYIIAIPLCMLCSLPYAKSKETLRINDIVINEIMADPSPAVGLPGYEYVELFNRSEMTISLEGWTMEIGTRKSTLGNVSIPPKGYLILTSKEAEILFTDFGNTYGLGSMIINNSAQLIVLKDQFNRIVNAIEFSDKWYGSDYKKEGGWALEQVDAANACGGKYNWKASIDNSGGTPGRKNSVMAVNSDDNPPKPIRAGFVDSSAIKIYFSEPLDSSSIMDKYKFMLDNNIGYPASVKPIPPFYNSAVLTFNSVFSPDIIYYLSLYGEVTDCAGNHSESAFSVRFAIPKDLQPNDIIINEILTNPYPGGVDFIEIYNRSKKVLDMKDILLCTLGDTNALSSQKNVSNESYLIFPGDYFVLTTDADIVKRHYFSANPEGFVNMSSLPQYNNDNGIVVISDKPGNIIDKLIYSSDMHFPLLNDTKGVTLERICSDLPTQDNYNWHSAAQSAGFGTPAYRNSQSILQKENDNAITISPEIFSPDNDGKDDVLLIQYSFDEPGWSASVIIYDSKGRLVKRLANNQLVGSEGSFLWDGINDSNEPALTGIYIIYVEAHTLKGKVRQYKKTAVLAGSGIH